MISGGKRAHPGIGVLFFSPPAHKLAGEHGGLSTGEGMPRVPESPPPQLRHLPPFSHPYAEGYRMGFACPKVTPAVALQRNFGLCSAGRHLSCVLFTYGFRMKNSLSRIYISILLLCVLTGLGVLLKTYFVPVTGGTDQNGYHVGSWMIYDQGRFSQEPTDDYEFVGHMWVVNEQGLYYPKYPPLYPLLGASAIRVTGQWNAGFWLSPLCALLTVAGVFVLFRNFLSGGWALLGALLMAGTPVFLFYGLNKASHAPSMAFVTWGMAGFFAAACQRNLKPAWLPALLGGFLLGYAVGIRYTNILLILPPLVYAGFTLRGRRWWIPFFFLAGAAIPCLFLAGFHQQAFGALWRTGYALTQEQSGFSWAYFLPNLRLYATGILDHGTGPVTLFSMIGWVLLFHRQPRKALMFCSWILPLFLLYNCYYWAPTESFAGYLRFIMPVLVPLYLLALLGFKALIQNFPRRQKIFIVGVVLMVQSVWGLYQGIIQAELRWMRDSLAVKYVEFAEAEVPEGSVIIADSGLLNDLDFGKRWNLYSTQIFDPNQLKRIRERNAQTEVHPLQRERVEKWNALLVDVPRATYNARIQELIQGHLDEGRRVYFLGPSKRIDIYRNRFRRQMEMEVAAELHGSIPAYQWINPAKNSMRNMEVSEEKKIPDQTLLEIKSLRPRPATQAVLREDMIKERQEKIQLLYQRYPEAKALFQSIERLGRQILKIHAPQAKN